MSNQSDLIKQQEYVSKACQSAESVLNIFERRSPGDRRPAEAIAAARRWIEGSATTEDCRIAYVAAEDAAEMALNAGESNEARSGKSNSTALAYASTHAADAAAMAAKAASMPAHAAGYANYAAASASNAAYEARQKAV